MFVAFGGNEGCLFLKLFVVAVVAGFGIWRRCSVTDW